MPEKKPDFVDPEAGNEPFDRIFEAMDKETAAKVTASERGRKSYRSKDTTTIGNGKLTIEYEHDANLWGDTDRDDPARWP